MATDKTNTGRSPNAMEFAFCAGCHEMTGDCRCDDPQAYLRTYVAVDALPNLPEPQMTDAEVLFAQRVEYANGPEGIALDAHVLLHIAAESIRDAMTGEQR